MITTQEQRMEVYQTLTDEMKHLYSSQEAAALNRKMLERFGLSEKQANDFLDITGDVILGFYKISDMPRLFQQKLGVSADESQRMISRLIELLGPVVQREEREANEKKAEMTKLTNTFAKPEGIAHKEIVQSVPPVTETIEPIRTMAEDMNRVHGYGAYREQEGAKETESTHNSSQDDLLKKEPPTPLS